MIDVKLSSVGKDGNETEIFSGSEKGFTAAMGGMRLNEIRTAIPELEAACNRLNDASEDFTNLCKLVALKAGADASVVKTFITARVNETAAKTERKAEQLGLLFDEIA